MNMAQFLLICGLLIAIVLILFLPTRRSGTRASTSDDRQFGGAVFRDDDRYWSWGFFYNNPDDPAVFVPKRYGMGWTVNFGRPLGKVFLIGTLLLPLLLAILGAFFPGIIHSYGCHPSGCNSFL